MRRARSRRLERWTRQVRRNADFTLEVAEFLKAIVAVARQVWALTWIVTSMIALIAFALR